VTPTRPPGEFLRKLAEPAGDQPAVKVCGFTIPDEARAACEAGVDALGINFYPKSKRYVAFEDCRDWLGDLPDTITRVGIFVNEDAARVEEIAQSGLIDAVQLHGDETIEYSQSLLALGVTVIKAFGVKDPDSLRDIGDFGTDLILLDAWCPGDFGGSGKTFDWRLAAKTVCENPQLRVILSGGLDPSNVADAVGKVRPAAVDVATGVEDSPGRKNLEQIRQFVEQARRDAADLDK
jgi:phosphoribosylanthranilate isomerase